MPKKPKSKKSNKLPPEVITHWPEVFDEIDMNVVPLEYLHSIRVTFNDGKVWDIDLRSPKNQEVSDVQDSLDDLFDEYQDQIQTVDFRLDTERVKKDITRRTKRFLKLGK